MNTACRMQTREKLLQSRMNSFKVLNARSRYTTMHSEVFTASAEVVDCINFSLSKEYKIR